jgi:hypothetical protein
MEWVQERNADVERVELSDSDSCRIAKAQELVSGLPVIVALDRSTNFSRT